MALNAQTFKTRTLTAVFFVLVMLAGLLINHWTFFILFSIIHFGCWFEYQKLIRLIDADYAAISPFHKYGVMLLGWGFMMFMTNKAYHLIATISLNELGWFALLIGTFALPVTEIVFSRDFMLKRIAYSIFGLVYISVSCGLMMELRNHGMSFKGDMLFFDFGFAIPCTIIFSMWVNDTMAYIVGSFIGKTPFSKISPKKTWEGTIGGIILTIAVAFAFSYFTDEPNYKTVWIAAVAAIAGTVGDLLESKLKRMAGVKDSGSIMPGHGGFLDRFDSLLLAVPFVWAVVYFIG